MAVMRFKSEPHCAAIRSCTYTTKFSSLESSAMRSPIAKAAVPQAVVFFISGSKPSLMYVQLHVMHVDPFVTDRQAAVTADDFDDFDDWFGSKDKGPADQPPPAPLVGARPSQGTPKSVKKRILFKKSIECFYCEKEACRVLMVVCTILHITRHTPNAQFHIYILRIWIILRNK